MARRGCGNEHYRAAWWLPDGHTATLWGRVGRREPVPPMRVHRLDTPDGDFLQLVRLVTSPDISPDAPRLLLLHGLEGGMHSHYVKAMFREAETRGWGADLLLFRTCGDAPNRLPRSYHSGETTDPAFVLQQLLAEFPRSQFGLVGVSLGGNVLCKMLGEWGADVSPRVAGAVAMSVPFSLARASRHIGRGFGAVYEKAFLRSLIPKALAKIERHPELASLRSVIGARTLWEFDDHFTAPLHGFVDAADYYARASSLPFLGDIRTRTLLLSAVDDPFLPPDVLDDVRRVGTTNPWLTLEFPERGGHVGFTAGRWPWRPWYYGEWRAAEFLSARFEMCSGSAPDLVPTSTAPSMSPPPFADHHHSRAVRTLGASLAALCTVAACHGTPPARDTAPPVTANQTVRAADNIPTGTNADADSLLVELRMLDNTIAVDMRYRGTNNFTGAPLPGYEANRAYLHRDAARALAIVQRALRADNLGLLVYDAYRPVRATNAMVAWTQRVHRESLVRDGYISDRSRHNLGVAIDLTLVRLSTGEPLDMGTPFDTFSADAHTANATGIAATNRARLVAAMAVGGFKNYDQEWWHFTFDVPSPRRFDKVIR